MDQLDIPPAERWDRAVQKALETCEKLLVILSPRAVDSENVLDEVHFAIGRKKPVVPVLQEKCNIPYRLIRFQRIDLTADYEQGFTSLLNYLGTPRSSSPQKQEVADAEQEGREIKRESPKEKEPQLKSQPPHKPPPTKSSRWPVKVAEF